jgi:hypothetical protein
MVEMVLFFFGSLVFLLANQRIVVRLDDIIRLLIEIKKKGEQL